MKKKTFLLALAAMTMLLAACSGVMDSKQPARQVYMLTPYSGAADTANPVQGPELSISISAVPGLDTDRVLALSNDARLNQYANARWPDHLPEVLTSIMKRSLMSAGRFSSVEESNRASGDGWLLVLEVQQFYGIRSASGDTSTVNVEMAGSIECNDLRYSFTLFGSSPVADERLSAVVAAHQRGLDDVTAQLLDQINETCS